MSNNALLALNAIRQALSASDHEINQLWLERIKSARTETPIAFKRWLTGKDSVDMAQITVNADNKITGSWLPGRRDVVIKSTYATFNGSIRDFAGHTHLFHSEDVFISASPNGDSLQISVYVA